MANELTSAQQKRDLGTILVEKNIISNEVLDSALEILVRENKTSMRYLAQVLEENFKVDADRLYKEVSDYYAFRTIDLDAMPINDDRLTFIRKTLDSLPKSTREKAASFKVVPYASDPAKENRLLLVSPNPMSREVYDIARAFNQKRFEICFIPPSQWQDLWRKVSVNRLSFAGTDVQGKAGPLQEAEEEEVEEGYEKEIEQEINNSGLVSLVEKILVDGVRVGASDIHIIPKGEKVTEFHLRIDGKLTLWHVQTDVRAEAVSAVLKDRAKGLDRFERNTAQDGFAQMVVDGKTIRFRLSVIPVIGRELRSKHESIVIRILQEPNFSIRIEDLGFSSYAEKCLREAIGKPHGIIILTGPTGSGKSTTLVAALRAIMDPSLNVLTVEDPVEYLIEGARQIKLNNKLDFEGALRAILRHDPDVVMVGEMRDRLTAEIAIKLANTGHLTLSTLHTNDAPSAVARLMKMGVEPFLIAYAINLVVAQRLVRKLCPNCRKPVKNYEPETLHKLGMTDEEISKTVIYGPNGCADCINGYRGRIAIHEALYFSREIRRVIMQSETFIDEDMLREIAIKNGMQTLRQAGIDLLKSGITSLEEVATVTVSEE